MSSSIGTARRRGWLSTALSSCVIESFWPLDLTAYAADQKLDNIPLILEDDWGSQASRTQMSSSLLRRGSMSSAHIHSTS
jgi:hypothetical protein